MEKEKNSKNIFIKIYVIISIFFIIYLFFSNYFFTRGAIKVYNKTTKNIENIEILFSGMEKENIFNIYNLDSFSERKLFVENFRPLGGESSVKIRFEKNGKKYEKIIIGYVIGNEFKKVFLYEKNGEIDIIIK